MNSDFFSTFISSMTLGTKIQNSAQGSLFSGNPIPETLTPHNRKFSKLSPNHLSRNPKLITPKLINLSPNPLSP
jgi:hypothetical protein